ncbi:Atrial natriuretic peptide-converting enzyme [Eufriesea mexicana]|nr:Atrial natriuretic peptide-converting enzyme [Eufriesea mexicana]
MSTADGMDNPAFASEEECGTESKLDDGQQQATLDQDHKSEGGPVENGHQRPQFVSQQYVEAGRTSPDPHYRTETKIELPDSNDKTVVEPKMNGVHGNGNNNDASFLNNSATSVQINDTGKKEQIEAVNLELVSMRPYAGNNLQTKGQEACEVPADPYEEYFVPVNEHRKYIRGPEAEVETTVAGVRFDLGPGVGREGLSLRDPAAGLVDYSHWLTALRGEKLYVTKDKRSRSSYWRRMACWGCGLLVLLVAVIIAILAATGVILAQEASEPLENLQQTNSRQFGDVRTAGSQEYLKDPPLSPPPATSTFPPWSTTDETIYDNVPSALAGVLKLNEFRWNNDLNDPKSRVYRQVSSEIEEYLKSMLQQPADNVTVVKVYDINRDGEVKFRISYPLRSMPEETQHVIEQTLQKNGNMIGQYHLGSLKVNKLVDECRSGSFGCSEECNYDYFKGLFVCSCGPGKMLDSDGKRCVDDNDLSNVEMDDEVPETNTEVVHDYVQGRSRGPGTVFEPRRPDNWDHLDFSTETTHNGHVSPQHNEHEFHAYANPEHDSAAVPEPTQPSTEPDPSAEPKPSIEVVPFNQPKSMTEAEPSPEPSPEPVTEPNSTSELESSTNSIAIDDSELLHQPGITVSPEMLGDAENSTEHELSTSSTTEANISNDEKPHQDTSSVTENSIDIQDSKVPKDSSSTGQVSEKPIDGMMDNDEPLPVIPLMTDDKEPVTSNHTSPEDHSARPSATVTDATIMEDGNEGKTMTTSSVEMDKQGTPKVEQVTETNMPQDETAGYTTMNINNDVSGVTNSSSEASSIAPSSTQSSVLEVGPTTNTETTRLAVETKSENITQSNSIVESSSTESNSDGLKLQNISATSNESSAQPEPTVHETNETNVIEHMPTTVFPKLPKNFGHNVEPLIEPLKNDTDEEHIMLIPKTEHATEVHDPHAIIPQLIPEQSVQSSNGSSVGVLDGSAHHSTIHPEENVVSVGDSVRYEDNLDHSTNHPLHPAVFPENAVEQATEKFDPTYDKHIDDMSPFLPDVQKEKEIKKAPRLDKDEQDVPNPFEGHVEDVVTYKSLTEMSTTEQTVNQTELKDSLNDVHTETHGIKRPDEQEDENNTVKSIDIGNEVGRGFKSDGLNVVEINDTESGIQNGLNNYEIINKPAKAEEDVLNEQGGKSDSEEDEEALKVVPLEEQFKEVETTVKYSTDKDKSETTTEANVVTTIPVEENEKQSIDSVAKNITTTSEKPEENAVEDQYNDITDDTLPKGYQQDDSEIRKKIKDESDKLIANNDETSFKPTDAPSINDKINVTINDTENTMAIIGNILGKHAEDAKLTTQIPVLPMEIQQEMSTTEKIESTTVTEENPRTDNNTEHHSTNVSIEDVTTVQIPTTHTMSMETKTTAQVPILPEELQTTESDALLTTSTMKPDTQIKNDDVENVGSDSEQVARKDSPKAIIDDDNNNNTTEAPNTGQQVDIQNDTVDDLKTSALEHIGNRSIQNTWLQTNVSMFNSVNASEENVTMPSVKIVEENVKENVTENPISEIASSTSSSETVTMKELHKQILGNFNITEDVRPVTEILEDDTEPIGFDYRTHFITTTPKNLLPDLDVGELSEEDLKVIPLEKSLEVKKKSVDKKPTDKYKYKKEKELNLDENEGENVLTEVPEPATVFLTEIPQMVTEKEKAQGAVHNATSADANTETVKSTEENSAPVPKLKIIETTSGSNQTEAQISEISSRAREDLSARTSITVPDAAKKYPSFIPVSERIIEPEPVTQPFVILRNYHLQRSNVDFTTEKPSMISVFPNEGHTAMGSGQAIELDNQTDVNQITKERNMDTILSPSTQTRMPDSVVESTSHIDVSFLGLSPNVVFSKCTAGQFQCVNGTSRDGAYCVKLSATCDSENDCSDGSDELYCEEKGCPGNFQCASGQCLKRDLVCNKIVDCDDGSDEKNCEEWKCQFDEFRCPNGRCIPGIWQCDGRPDCEDHRDEYNCAESCGNDEYLCPTEKWCIPLTWHCNGISECANGEDEKLCDCALDQFKCQTGGCVPENQVCDGIEHCPDHSDEWGCLMTNTTTEKKLTDGQKDDEIGSNGAQELSESYLLKIRQYNGEYRLVCSDGWSEEFSNSYCQSLGFAGSEITELQTWDKTQKILRLKSNPNHHAPLVTNLEQVEFCVSDKVVQISCQEFSCGSHYGEGPTARLVGGTLASEGELSSVALLKEPKQGAACTASVLGPMHALASYSCIHRYKQSNGWQLFTGENLLKAHPVRNIIPYPQVKYNQFLYNNDIALVELEMPLRFSRNVSAVCLPKHPIQPRQICVMVGWGFSVNGEVDLQKYLNFLPLPTFDSEKCNATSHYAGFITKDNICAGFTDTDKGPCYNDEGAPLMCSSESGGESARWEIQGLLSHHSRCSRGHPAIYSSVEPALSWLRNSVPALQTQS